jgi:hypothetical protein
MWRRYLAIFLVVSFGGLVAVMFEEQDPLVLTPSNSAHKVSALLLYLPGANVPIEAYTPLGEALQREFDAHGASLTVVFVRYPTLFNMDFPPFWNPESMVTSALNFMDYQGDAKLRDMPFFMGGHSLGAILGQIIAFKEARIHSYTGVILHSGFIMDKYRRTDQLPLPTLTMSGTRDGLNRLTYLATQYKDLRSHGRYLHDSPAALIEGMNHMQLAGGHSNKYTQLKDLEPTITTDEALRQVASYSTLFLLKCMNESVDLSSLFQVVKESEDNFFRPYIEAFQSDVSGETCVSTQHIHFEDQATSREIWASEPILKRTRRPNFIFAKPLGNYTHVKVETYATKAYTLFGRSSVPQALQTLNCKILTKEQVFGKVSEFDSCGAINQQLVNDAVSTLSERTRQDYASSPNKWVFEDDKDFQGGFGWTFTGDLMFLSTNPVSVGVVCPRLKTTPGTGRYSGKLYCGLVSKSRAIEFVLIDAYRKRQSIDDDENYPFVESRDL